VINEMFSIKVDSLGKPLHFTGSGGSKVHVVETSIVIVSDVCGHNMVQWIGVIGHSC